MKGTLAFDIYGTLIDTQGITGMLEKHAGFKAEAFSQFWRQKVLEYSFRRGLMDRYLDFAACTGQALDYTLEVFGIPLSAREKTALLDAYRELPVFDDVSEGLSEAENAGFRIYAFSNGKRSDVEHLLDHGGIRKFFIDIVSVDEVRKFKPDPEVYRHFLKRSSSQPEQAWLVSSNPFDVLGAVSAGMKSVWVRRSLPVIMDPWEIAPGVTIEKLPDIVPAIASFDNTQVS